MSFRKKFKDLISTGYIRGIIGIATITSGSAVYFHLVRQIDQLYPYLWWFHVLICSCSILFLVEHTSSYFRTFVKGSRDETVRKLAVSGWPLIAVNSIIITFN